MKHEKAGTGGQDHLNGNQSQIIPFAEYQINRTHKEYIIDMKQIINVMDFGEIPGTLEPFDHVGGRGVIISGKIVSERNSIDQN